MTTNSDSLDDLLVSRTMEDLVSLSSSNYSGAPTATKIPAHTKATASSSSRLISNRQVLDDLYPQFPRTWVPIASTLEMEPTRPNRLEFLGQSYVTYRTSALDNRWVVMDDTCPHRLAPLSEGRVEPETGRLECSYHGWTFESDGSCQRIPQATGTVQQAALQNPLSCVPSYTTMVDPQTGLLWIWPWNEDPLKFARDKWRHPEGIMEGVVHFALANNATQAGIMTYTRDQPYGWDTLVENLMDPAHVPFAHHGLQGTRNDAIPINMTSAVDLGEAGFSLEWQDRTMGLMRTGKGTFRAPFMDNYNATILSSTDPAEPLRPFRLTVFCIPTKPGWSRVITLAIPPPAVATANAPAKKKKKTKRKFSLFSPSIFRRLPPWVGHLLSNNFFDSDLVFLHYQEQKRWPTATAATTTRAALTRGDDRYFMPAECDRSVAALYRWIGKYAFSYVQNQSSQLPSPIYDRNVLFNHYEQHTKQCKVCAKGLSQVARWKRRCQWAFAASILVGLRHWPARILAVVCLGLFQAASKLETYFYKGNYQHYDKH